MTLYEMSEAAQQLYELLLAEEIDEETVSDTLEAMDVECKLEDYCKVIRQYEADAMLMELEAAKLKEKQKRAEKAAERLKSNILYFFQVSGKDKQKAGTFTVSTRNTESIEVTVPAESLPEVYRRTKITVEADKKLLKAALKGGAQIEGVAVKTNQSINIK